MSETWAGVLIGLSACAYAVHRQKVAAPLGLLALFIRELAAPYCMICALAAIVRRRWHEVATWLGGACLYAAYYSWHLTQVWAHRLPTDLAHTGSWLEGGLSFLLIRVRWHAWLLIAPMPLTALALVLVVAGIVHAGAPRHIRLTSATYVAFFLVTGQYFDTY